MYWARVYPDNITLLNLGNSHAMKGLRYNKYYKGIAHNFALPFQPFVYDYYLLRHIHDNIAPGAVVIVPISYFDWYLDFPELFTGDKHNSRYYSLLPPEYIYNYNMVDDIQYNIFPVLTAKDNLKYIFNDVQLPQPEEEDKITVKAEDLDHTAKERAELWKNDHMAPDEDKDEVKQANILYFKKTIVYCISMGCRPVVVCCPVTEDLTAQFSADFMNDFDSTIREVLSEYEGIVFLDYSRDPEFSENISYFSDADHLNSAGGEAFTGKLLGDLVELAVIPRERLNLS